MKAQLPDKMTGKDLIVQEEYEQGLDKALFNSMDKIDRRDKRNHIFSMAFSKQGRKNYEKIDWRK